METHIHTGYTSSVGVQYGNTHSHRIYKLRGSPAWKHIFTQEDIQAPWESSIEIHIRTRGYTNSVGVQHGNTHSHTRIYKLRGSPAWKHTIGGALVLTWGGQVEDNNYTIYV